MQKNCLREPVHTSIPGKLATPRQATSLPRRYPRAHLAAQKRMWYVRMTVRLVVEPRAASQNLYP